jgi:glycosyltransferase involved in cell wall biosynthesis
MTPEPFVSIVTPVYNGEPFLAESIESVLAQDYAYSEHIIVNNCSTDRTLELAEQYARHDRRIRVVNNEEFVNCEENHNNAFRQISVESEYCKVVSADDRLLPQALGKMVRFAVQHPTVGIVGSYQESNGSIRWKGLPEDVSVLSGREACRLGLLKGIHVFGSPMSVLYRCDLIRRTSSFFPNSEAHADTSACYAHLHDCDFGFIHEVLSVERVHEGQLTTFVDRFNAGIWGAIDILIQYGPLYLSEAELATRLEEVLAGYYRVLGGCVLKMKGRDYWAFQESRLSSRGYALDWRRVSIEAMLEFARELRNPVTALLKLKSALEERSKSGTAEPTDEPKKPISRGRRSHWSHLGFKHADAGRRGPDRDRRSMC